MTELRRVALSGRSAGLGARQLADEVRPEGRVLAVIEELDDVGVTERREHLDFADEARRRGGVALLLAREQHLDGHELPAWPPGAIDSTAAPAREGLEELDECHEAGSCDPQTGCSNPAKAEGTPCSVGTCVAGTCTPTEPGTGGAGGTSASSTSSASSTGSGGGSNEESGCGCSVAGEPTTGGLWITLGLVIAAGRRARKREKIRMAT
jgi:MYXO-CTERM domain-containing protein